MLSFKDWMVKSVLVRANYREKTIARLRTRNAYLEEKQKEYFCVSCTELLGPYKENITCIKCDHTFCISCINLTQTIDNDSYCKECMNMACFTCGSMTTNFLCRCRTCNQYYCSNKCVWNHERNGCLEKERTVWDYVVES